MNETNISNNNKLNRGIWVTIVPTFFALFLTIYNTEIDKDFSWEMLITGYYMIVFWATALLSAAYMILKRWEKINKYFTCKINNFVLNQVYFSLLILIVFSFLDSNIFNLIFGFDVENNFFILKYGSLYIVILILITIILNLVLYYQKKITIINSVDDA